MTWQEHTVKTPNVSDLVKKADYDAKISEIENQCFTTSDYYKLTSNNTLDAKITKKFVDEFDLNENIKTLATISRAEQAR